ncbi:MAG: MqnA/MqnD/SBP family protein, partial [Planctomycetota bacterium]
MSTQPENSPTLRIGAVNYLNSKPLVHGLAERLPACRVLFDLPSRLADSLAAGRLDVALIPVKEYFAGEGYRVVSDACVASHGPVRSVKVFFRRPPAEVRTLALDEGSRTSAALARVLLARRLGVRPATAPLAIGDSTGDTAADAVLLIGDRAML